MIAIQEAHPIKQGLKQWKKSFVKICNIYSRGASNKTRIETKLNVRQIIRIEYSRGASNKTRIETSDIITNATDGLIFKRRIQ